MKPGTTAFTVTPDGASSIARRAPEPPARLRRGGSGEHRCVGAEHMCNEAGNRDHARIAPAFRCGIAARARRKNAPWIASTDAVIAASVSAANAVRSAKPALLTSTSRPPNRAPRARPARPPRRFGEIAQRDFGIRPAARTLRRHAFRAVTVLPRMHQQRRRRARPTRDTRRRRCRSPLRSPGRARSIHHTTSCGRSRHSSASPPVSICSVAWPMPKRSRRSCVTSCSLRPRHRRKQDARSTRSPSC